MKKMTPEEVDELNAGVMKAIKNHFRNTGETLSPAELIVYQAQEIATLRQFGNKDCTAMADEALVAERENGIPALM